MFVATGKYGDDEWQFHGEGYGCKRRSGVGVYTVARRRLKAKAAVESENDSDAKERGDDYLQLRPKVLDTALSSRSEVISLLPRYGRLQPTGGPS